MAERYWLPVSLPCRLPWVGSWHFPEQFQQVAEVERGATPNHTNHFRVACSAGTDLVVGGVLGLAPRIAHGRAHHPWQPPKALFSSPEASAGKDRFFLVRHQWRIQRRPQNSMRRWCRCFSAATGRQPGGQHVDVVDRSSLGS